MAFNKPYGVICQFSAHERHPTLAAYIPFRNVYPAGRLDTDSEGLLILTSDGVLQHRIASPGQKLAKRYAVQVEGHPDDGALQALRQGVDLADGRTRPCKVVPIPEPDGLWARTPPIRFRRDKPTSWLSVELTEGRNRQVRRMTAHVGFPTLRLVRVRIGRLDLGTLQPGQWRIVDPEELGLPALARRSPPRTGAG